MLDVLRRGRRWLIGGLILFIGGSFIFYLGFGGSGPVNPREVVVRLGDREYTRRDLRRARDRREQRIREALGDDYNPATAGRFLEDEAARSLVRAAVFAHEAERAGFRTSDEELGSLVHSIESFRSPEGGVDADLVRRYAEQQYGSLAGFTDALRDQLLTTKLHRLIDLASGASPAQARDALRYRDEEIRIAYTVLDPEVLRGELEVESEEIEELLAESPQRVRDFYDQHLDRYREEEQVWARHILFQLDPGADEESERETRERAEAALAELRAGREFADLARELSDDPGSREQGGDLGWFSRGQMVPAFDEIAFTLEPGTLSEPVRSDFGYHVIRVEERREETERSFDDVAREIAEELVGQDQAETRAEELADELKTAIAGGESLVDAARARGLTLERPDWLSRSARYVDGLGEAPELIREAFALTPERTSSSRIFEIDGKRALVERLELRTPEAQEVDALVEDERERLLSDQRYRLREQWFDLARERLAEDGQLEIRVDTSTPGGAPAS